MKPRITEGPGKPALHARLRSLLHAICLFGIVGNAHAAVTSAMIVTGTSAAPTGSPAFNALPTNIMPTPDACTIGNNGTYTPGNDPCATDLIVRTNDDVTYNIQYVTSGADTVTIKSVLPLNGATPIADWKAVPPQCTGGGSGISPDGQTLTCVISVTASATASILPQATVRGTMANATSFPIPSTTVTGAGGGNFNANLQPGSTTTPVTVSAAPLYDVSKHNNISPTNIATSWAKGPDGVTDGWLFNFDVAVRVPYGAKGVEALNASGLTLTDVASTITFTSANPAVAAAVQSAFQANAQLYNGTANPPWPGAIPNSRGGCWGNAAMQARDPLMPNGFAATAGFNAIGASNNGTCTATQIATGGPITVKVTGANWTNTHFPTQSNDLALLPQPSDYWLVSDQIGIWVPASVFAGVPSGTTVTGTNAYSSVTATSISGRAIAQPTVTDPSAGGTVNDTAKFNFTQSTNFGITKYYGDCGPGNNSACQSLNIVGNHTRTGVAVPGQAYITIVYFANQGTIPLTNAVTCDKIDNTKNILAINSPTGTPMAGVYNVSDSITLAAGTDYIVEYGTGGLNGAGASWASNADYAIGTCAQDQSPAWYTNANDPAIGGLDKITKVRVTFLNPVQPAKLYDAVMMMKSVGTSTVTGFGSPAGTAWPVGTPINNWNTATARSSGTGATVYPANGDNFTADLAGNVWITGGINGSADGQNPYAASGVANFGYSDTITQSSAFAHIAKTATTSTGSTSAAIAGTTVTYSLVPSLSAPTAGLPATTMTVTDILPPHVSYVAGSASVAPNSIQSGVPEAGYTTLVWTISATPNVTVTPITYDALVDATASNGTVIPNFALAASPIDSTPCNASGGDYDQILNTGYVNNNATGGGVSGTLCARAARNDLTISAPPGFKTFKTVDKSQIEPNGSFTYTLSWVSNGTPPATIDLIDVLPWIGDGRTPATAYTGTRTLAAAPSAVSGDGAATFWYTDMPASGINPDPQAPGNGAFGAPGGIWCNAIGGVGINCPATLAAVTAIRMVSGTPLADGVARSFTYTVDTGGNATGDLYTNDFVTRGTGLTNVVISNDVTTAVVTGSIAGLVYADINNDGAMAPSGEPGIDDVRVCLAGYSFGPNGIDDGGAGDDIALPSLCEQTYGGGHYLFVDLLAGHYTVTKDSTLANSPGLAGFVGGSVTVGSFGGTVAANAISAIVLPAGGNGTNYLFGEIPVGTIVVDKTVVGIPSNTGWTFTLSTATPGCAIPATLTNPATTPPGSGVSVSFPNLPVYSTTAPTLTSCVYDVAETAQAGYQLNAANSTLSGSVTINGTTTLDVENDQLYGDLIVTKSVTGGPASYSGSFPITAACTFNGAPVTGIAPSATQNVTAGTGSDGQVTFANIPQGATCTISEGTLPTPPTSYTFGTPTLTQPSTAIGATPVDASVQNTLSQQFGSLDVTKNVSGAPSGYSDAFAITATCTLDGAPVTGITPSATQTVTAGTGTPGTVTFANIPQGAICTVGEGTLPTPPTSYVWAASTPTITQPGAIAATPATASVVNTMVLQVAGLTVVKTVAGGPSSYSGTFPVSVACTFNGGPVTGITPSATQNVTAGTSTSGSVTFGNIPQGSACTVSEGTLPTAPTGYTWGTPAITQPGAIAATGSTATVANSLTQQFGSLSVTKTVTGGAAGYSGSFPITAACTFNGAPVTGITPSATQTVTAGTGTPGTLTFANIPQGATCTISEGTLPTPPASYTFGTPAITQPATAIGAAPVSASVLNTLSQQFGSLNVTKSVSGAPSGYSGSFPITAACTFNGALVTGITPSATQTVTAGTSTPGTLTFANIPHGATCTVSEGTLPTPPASYAWVAGTPTITQPAGAIAATPAAASVVNTMVLQVAGLTVVKTVAGGPSTYSGSFPISVACTLNGNPVTGITPSATQNVTAGTSTSGSVNFGNIPQGATCAVSEGMLPTAPTGYTWATPAITQSGAIAATGSTATVANTLTASDPPFHLTKTVTGGPSTLNGTFVFDIDCGAAGMFTQSVTLANAASGSVAISNIPFGRVCVFSEASNLPTAPNGFVWGALPAAQTRTIDGSDVSFVNTLIADVVPPTLPRAVPTLRDAMLALLALLMIGAGAHAARSRQHKRSGR